MTTFKADIQKALGDKSPYILDYPVVYIHAWKNAANQPYQIYVGESNDVSQRTNQHLKEAVNNPKSWQKEMISDGVNPEIYIAGHEHFNKSLTLDIENRLIDYAFGLKSVARVHNRRGNPQGNYYLLDELDGIFGKIWKALRQENKELFLPEKEVRDSAIFKASPFHKLTKEQQISENKIITQVGYAILEGKENQLIFVHGEAGSGKTVLMSSVFASLMDQAKELFGKELTCALLVNHDEQKLVYEEIVKKLGYDKEKYVFKPTQFINAVKRSDVPIDVVFVDEGHLLLTQGKFSYTGKNQLDDIMERARVTVVMFDENQVLTTEEYWESYLLDEKIALSKQQDNYIELKEQLRMHCGPSTKKWVDAITQSNEVIPLEEKDENYEIRVFDSPEELHKAIKKKASQESSALSRIIASYDWEYSSNHKPTGQTYWGVKIGNFFLPWNREIARHSKGKKSHLAWAEQPATIDEAGSTFTIQGFDLNYAGVIIGPSVTYRDGKIVFDPSKSKSDKATRKRTLSDGTKKSFGEELIKHELRVLLTRGAQGLYIYACDDQLREALKKSLLGITN